MLRGFLVLAFPLLTAPVLSSSQVEEEWKEWKKEQRKYYSSPEVEQIRLKIFTENRAKVARHNALAARGEVSFYLGINRFGDQLAMEVAQAMNGFRRGNASRGAKHLHQAQHLHQAHLPRLPEQVDWRDLGAITQIKNQGRCGSCWSFATAGALEGMHYRSSGRLVSLSEQQLLDCSAPWGNQGCNGGEMANAYTYVTEVGGLDTERSYLYEGEVDVCRYNPLRVGAREAGYMAVRVGDELGLQEAVATQGPCSAAIDASHSSFHLYSHGVYRSSLHFLNTNGANNKRDN